MRSGTTADRLHAGLAPTEQFYDTTLNEVFIGNGIDPGGVNAVATPVKAYRPPTRCGLLIPFYIYPGGGYSDANINAICNLARKFPNLPITVILNPSNGAGASTDGNYTVAIELLIAAGVSVAAYVHTSYMARTIAAVEADIDSWMLLYPKISALFIDEVDSTGTASSIYYTKTLTDYGHLKGLYPVIGNPGAGVSNAYYLGGACDVLVVYENAGQPPLSGMQGAYQGGYIEYDFHARAALAYSVPSIIATDLQLIMQNNGMALLTDQPGYSALPSYLSTLVEAMAQEQPSVSSAIAVAASPMAYTANDSGLLVVGGGVVTGVTSTRGGTIATLGVTPVIPVRPGDVVTLTYTTAPTNITLMKP